MNPLIYNFKLMRIIKIKFWNFKLKTENVQLNQMILSD